MRCNGASNVNAKALTFRQSFQPPRPARLRDSNPFPGRFTSHSIPVVASLRPIFPHRGRAAPPNFEPAIFFLGRLRRPMRAQSLPGRLRQGLIYAIIAQPFLSYQLFLSSILTERR